MKSGGEKRIHCSNFVLPFFGIAVFLFVVAFVVFVVFVVVAPGVVV